MIIGLTGGIASGKTTCSTYLANCGLPVVDADVVAREIVACGSPVLQKLVDCFGQEIIDSDGNLDRPALRERVFADEQSRKALDEIMHPVIHQRILEKLQLLKRRYPIVICSAPLLFENKLDTVCDMVVAVDISESLQIQRGSSRDGVSQEQIKKIMAAQISRCERLRKANYMVDNAGTIEDTENQCWALFQKISRMA